MTQPELTAGFVVWITTMQCVNFALYLGITQVTYGWAKTIGAYLIYFALLAAAFPMMPLVHGGSQGTAGALSVSFLAFYSLWSGLTMLLSRGAPGRRLFAILLCGIHQLIAMSFSLLIMQRLQSAVLGPLAASGLMALMGWFPLAWVRPRVERMPDQSGWSYLNVMTASLFVLLYAAGIWPIFLAGEASDHILLFTVAALVAIVFFPTALAFSEKSRLASSVASVVDNLRLMAEEMESRHEIIARARQIRNDRRNRRTALTGLLKQGKVDEALSYLERLGDAGEDDPQTESVWCENETVNAILAGYSRKAAATGLHFSAMASVNEECQLPEVEIVEMISNLLEIAIRTASGTGDVTCLIRQRTESFGVTITNTVATDFKLSAEGLPAASSDANLENVLALVRKYRGNCRYRLDKGLLSCETLLVSKSPSLG